MHPSEMSLPETNRIVRCRCFQAGTSGTPLPTTLEPRLLDRQYEVVSNGYRTVHDIGARRFRLLSLQAHLLRYMMSRRVPPWCSAGRSVQTGRDLAITDVHTVGISKSWYGTGGTSIIPSKRSTYIPSSLFLAPDLVYEYGDPIFGQSVTHSSCIRVSFTVCPKSAPA